MSNLTIGRVARAAGVNVETVRFYERKGLIRQPPKPSGGGPRDYGDDTAERIRFIRQAQNIGFSLSEIAELLLLRSDPSAGCADVRERAIRKRADVQAKLDGLTRMREALDALIARCPGAGGVEACSILDFMNQGDDETLDAE